MISSKDIFASRRLNCSLDVFFLKNLAMKVINSSFRSYLPGVKCFIILFADLKMSIELQILHFKVLRIFFAFQLPSDISTKFSTFCWLVLILQVFKHWFNFWFDMGFFVEVSKSFFSLDILIPS